MGKCLPESVVNEFLSSDETVYGFCEKRKISSQTFLRTLKALNIERPKRKRKYAIGAAHANWKGGRSLDKGGYVLLYMPDYPAANHAGYVREHRFVMEQHLGRPLMPGEAVHHKNRNKSDNRIENLILFSENGLHLHDELKGKIPKWTEKGRDNILRSVRRPHPHLQKKIDKNYLRRLHVDLGLNASAIGAILGVIQRTVLKNLHRNNIPVQKGQAHTRLTLAGLKILAENPKALESYAQGCPQFFSHLKGLLGRGLHNLSEKDYSLWLLQVFPRSKRLQKTVAGFGQSS